MRSWFLPVFVVSLVTTAHAASTTPVGSCGQIVGGKGILLADLTCSGLSEQFAVALQHGASLDLGGNTLTIDDNGSHGVSCGGSCKVFNGNLVMRGEVGSAISAQERVTVTDVVIMGVYNESGTRWGRGITGRIGKVTSTTVASLYDCATGFERLQVRGLQCLDNISNGVDGSKRVVVRDSTFEGYPNGALTGVTSTDVSGRVSVKASTIAGFEYSIVSWYAQRPVVRDTQCERSAVRESEGVTGTWGLCALD